MCLGKALTGGNITLAATLSTKHVAEGICTDNNVFMHGPTFMANPLACAIANASLDLLCSSPWPQYISRIETELKNGLAICKNSPKVADVRVLGAIGVVEMETSVNQAAIQTEFVKRGVWVRPFGKLVYLMPPFIIDDKDLQKLISAVTEITK
jgi:adenosylmethionine-8-amino-7-oxononanoate aminotransferase